MALQVRVDRELILKAISYALVELIWLTVLAVLWISIRKEARYGQL